MIDKELHIQVAPSCEPDSITRIRPHNSILFSGLICRLDLFTVLLGTLVLYNILYINKLYAAAPPVSTSSFNTYNFPKIPWSIHVIRIPREKPPLLFRSTHATGIALGLSPVTDQIKTLETNQWIPRAAINGDYYIRDGAYAGDPRGLQIIDGEMISAPAGTASFWINAIGEPFATNTVSQIQVRWPRGAVSPVGLNENRTANGIQLYTPSVGSSTKTAKGRELILDAKNPQQWLPLQAGKSYQAVIRQIHESGNSSISNGTMVLSIGPGAVTKIPQLSVGDEIVISTATLPSLRGVKCAISGGPVLIRNGKKQRIDTSGSDSYSVTSMGERHPRSAIGWNDNFYFLVSVDGRQKDVSVGMTLAELAEYMSDLGCKDAMNLDGGGSATLWYDGKVQNRPCDGYERPVANALVVLQKK